MRRGARMQLIFLRPPFGHASVVALSQNIGQGCQGATFTKFNTMSKVTSFTGGLWVEHMEYLLQVVAPDRAQWAAESTPAGAYRWIEALEPMAYLAQLCSSAARTRRLAAAAAGALEALPGGGGQYPALQLLARQAAHQVSIGHEGPPATWLDDIILFGAADGVAHEQPPGGGVFAGYEEVDEDGAPQ